MSKDHKKTNKQIRLHYLKKEVENLFSSSIFPIKNVNEYNMEKLIKTLDDYRLELELQNEELYAMHDTLIQKQEELSTLYNAYKDLFDYAPIGYLTVKKDGKIIEVNKTFYTIFNKQSPIPKHNNIYNFVVNDDKDKLFLHIRSVFKNKIKQTCEIRLQNGKINKLYVRLISSIEKMQSESCKIAIFDITKIREEEKKRKELENKYLNLVKNIPGMPYSGKKDWIPDVFINFEELTGYSIEHLKSGELTWLDIIHPLDREKILKETTVLRKKKISLVQEYRIVDKQKNEKWVVDHKTSKFTPEGVFNGIDGVIFEITHKKLLEDKKEKLIEKRIKKEKNKGIVLSREIKEVNRSNKNLEQFAFIASHDLKEPLRVINSYVELLKERYEDKLDEKAKKYMFFIADASERMLLLITSLLTFSRINREYCDFKQIDLTKVLETVKNNLEILIKDNNVRINNSPLPEFEGDEELLIQLFQNLISNAINFKKDKTPVININSKKEGENYVILVSDNGIGIKPQNCNKVFDLFFKDHNNNISHYGSGIGLSIAKRVVEAHNGTITIDSNLKKGTTIKLTFPYKNNRKSNQK